MSNLTSKIKQKERKSATRLTEASSENGGANNSFQGMISEKLGPSQELAL